MKVRKPQSFLCDLVNVRRADLAAKAAHVGETKVISDNDEKVRAFSHDDEKLSCQGRMNRTAAESDTQGREKKKKAMKEKKKNTKERGTAARVCSLIASPQDRPLLRSLSTLQQRGVKQFRFTHFGLASCSAAINRPSAVGCDGVDNVEMRWILERDSWLAA